MGEPGVFPVAPELVEALADAGELERAQAVAERLRALAERLEHPWGAGDRASAARAVVALAAGLRRRGGARRSPRRPPTTGGSASRFDRGALAAQPRPRAAAA